MVIEVGPYTSAAARAWLANARQLLDFAGANRAQLPFDLPSEVIEELRWYVDGWDNAAQKSDVFRWSGEVDATKLRTLLTYWLNLARVTDERHDVPTSPTLARVFYPGVVGELLDALEDEPGHRSFCRRMRTAWPGLGTSCRA